MTLHLCRFVVVTLVTLCAHAWSVPAAIARPSAVPPLVELVPQFKKYEECRAAADAGDAAAMLELAWRYENGRDVRRNVDDARAWLNKAVEVGHADAQFFLARNLAADTADFNLQRSATLLRAAADQGHVEAAYTYATVRLDGRGVEKDDSVANEYFLRAAEAGHAIAQAQVGFSYMNGRGTPANDASAVEWLRKAADQKNADAQRWLGLMCKEGRGIEKDARQALQWILKAAAQGHRDAQWDAAQIYKTGDGVPANLAQAARWLQKLAERRHYEAQLELAEIEPRTFQRLTERLTVEGVTVSNEPLSAVRAGCRLLDISAKKWSAAVDARTKIDIEASRIANRRIRPGLFVNVYGVWRDDETLEALLYDLPEPAIEWTHKLALPRGIIGGQVQTYTVNGTLTNSGVQPIKVATVTVRLQQVLSPNNERQTITLHDLEPGESRPFSADFDWYNYRYSGRTSIPRAEVTATITDW